MGIYPQTSYFFERPQWKNRKINGIIHNRPKGIALGENLETIVDLGS